MFQSALSIRIFEEQSGSYRNWAKVISSIVCFISLFVYFLLVMSSDLKKLVTKKQSKFIVLTWLRIDMYTHQFLQFRTRKVYSMIKDPSKAGTMETKIISNVSQNSFTQAFVQIILTYMYHFLNLHCHRSNFWNKHWLFFVHSTINCRCDKKIICNILLILNAATWVFFYLKIATRKKCLLKYPIVRLL